MYQLLHLTEWEAGNLSTKSQQNPNYYNLYQTFTEITTKIHRQEYIKPIIQTTPIRTSKYAKPLVSILSS